MKKIIFAVLSAILVSGAVYGEEKIIYGDSAVAIVGDRVITAFELQQASQVAEKNALAQALPSEIRKTQLQVRRSVLDRMIDDELVYQEFKRMKAKIPQSFVNDRLNKIIKMQAEGDRSKFEDMLHAENMTMDEFKERLTRNIAVEALLFERVKRGIQFSRRQIEEYFAEHMGDFSRLPNYRIEVIMLRGDRHTSEELEDFCRQIRAELNEGEAFSNLARKYSEGANALEGGDQGWKSEMNEQLMAVVKKLKVGEISNENLKLGNNIYLVRLAEFQPGSSAELTDEIAEEIRNRMIEAEESKRYDAFIEELKMKYAVRRMD